MNFGGEFPYSKYSQEALLETLRTQKPTTTSHVNICYIKPKTKDLGCSWARHLARSGSRRVARPTVFLSHAWRYAFKDLVAAAEGFVESESEASRGEVFFWNDIFVEVGVPSPLLLLLSL